MYIGQQLTYTREGAQFAISLFIMRKLLPHLVHVFTTIASSRIIKSILPIYTTTLRQIHVQHLDSRPLKHTRIARVTHAFAIWSTKPKDLLDHLEALQNANLTHHFRRRFRSLGQVYIDKMVLFSIVDES